MQEYFEGGPDGSHGIVSIHPGASGSWFFATGKGRLYEVRQREGSAAEVIDLGWFHPAGARYVASMFRDERTGSLHGVAAPNSNGTRSFDWVSRTPGGEASAVALRFGTGTQLPTGALLYGSMARDAAGNVYVAGTMANKPLIVQVAAFH